MTEFKAGDKVFLRCHDRDSNADFKRKWDGLRAVVVSSTVNGNAYMVRMAEGDVRGDGYDTEPFQWDLLELRPSDNAGSRGVDGVAEDPAMIALQERAASLQSQLADERSTRYNLQNELDEFKEKVVEVASRYAIENDWCNEVVKALEEMGLEGTRQRTVRISGYVTVSVPICTSADDLDLEITVNGDSPDLYNMEVSFDE